MVLVSGNTTLVSVSCEGHLQTLSRTELISVSHRLPRLVTTADGANGTDSIKEQCADFTFDLMFYVLILFSYRDDRVTLNKQFVCSPSPVFSQSQLFEMIVYM